MLFGVPFNKLLFTLLVATSKLEVPYLADDSTELVDGVESNFVMVSVIVGAQKLSVERVQGLKKKNIYFCWNMLSEFKLL